MNFNTKSLRSFIGSKNFALSKEFYMSIGFTMTWEGERMCYFRIEDDYGFYLQDYFVEEWVYNTMLFLEVEDLEVCYDCITQLDLTGQFPGSKLSTFKEIEGGREFFLTDPSGVLWHFGEFRK